MVRVGAWTRLLAKKPCMIPVGKRSCLLLVRRPNMLVLEEVLFFFPGVSLEMQALKKCVVVG